MSDVNAILEELDEETLYRLSLVTGRQVRKFAKSGRGAAFHPLLTLDKLLHDAHRKKLRLPAEIYVRD